MDTRVNLTIEVEQVGNGLAIQTPVPIQLVHHAGQWQAQCPELRIETAPARSPELESSQ